MLLSIRAAFVQPFTDRDNPKIHSTCTGAYESVEHFAPNFKFFSFHMFLQETFLLWKIVKATSDMRTTAALWWKCLVYKLVNVMWRSPWKESKSGFAWSDRKCGAHCCSAQCWRCLLILRQLLSLLLTLWSWCCAGSLSACRSQSVCCVWESRCNWRAAVSWSIRPLRMLTHFTNTHAAALTAVQPTAKLSYSTDDFLMSFKVICYFTLNGNTLNDLFITINQLSV